MAIQHNSHNAAPESIELSDEALGQVSGGIESAMPIMEPPIRRWPPLPICPLPVDPRPHPIPVDPPVHTMA
jgi:hypothetical protein